MIKTTDLYDRWIDALESGLYKKGEDYLRHRDEYCCLGVVCDISNTNGWRTEIHSDVVAFGPNLEMQELPLNIMQELQLATPDGVFSIDDLSPELYEKIKAILPYTSSIESLTNINDATNDFTLIIEILKERPPSLFYY